jgi:hypothetical protein
VSIDVVADCIAQRRATFSSLLIALHQINAQIEQRNCRLTRYYIVSTQRKLISLGLFELSLSLDSVDSALDNSSWQEARYALLSVIKLFSSWRARFLGGSSESEGHAW